MKALLTMTRLTQGLVLMLLGVYVVRIAITSEFESYVKAWMRWPLLASGVILMIVATITVLAGDDHEAGSAECEPGEPGEPGESGAPRRADAPEPRRDVHGRLVFDDPGRGGHDHAPSPTAWLLTLPFFVIVLIAPQPLGAFLAERRSNTVASANQVGFPPLSTAEPAPLRVNEFVARAQYDADRSLAGREVELTGFVSFDSSRPGWYVTRISLNCCAADATAFRVRVLDASAPAEDSWVRVIGTWVAPADGDLSVGDPEITARLVESVETPTTQYE